MDLSIKQLSRLAGIAVLTLAMLVLSVPMTSRVVSADGTCSITNFNPTDAPAGSTTGIAITVSDSATDLAYVHVAISGGGGTIVSANSDWYSTVTNDSSSATYSGDPITVGNDPQVSVSVSFADTTSDQTMDVDVTVSGSADGSGAYACGSTTAFTVHADTTPPPACATSTDITCRDVKLMGFGVACAVGWLTIRAFRFRRDG